MEPLSAKTLTDPDGLSPSSTLTSPTSPGSGVSTPTVPDAGPRGYTVGRRSHKKSRTGCTTCKARKIKCDERHPECLNCISHGVECPFKYGKSAPPPVKSQSRPSRAKTHARTVPAIDTSSPGVSPAYPTHPPPPREPDELPLLELELLHNFTVHTYSTLAADASICDFWRLTVVQTGLRYDYIMRAVLAVSALHLAYHRPDRRDFYTAQGIMFHQRATRSAMSFMARDMHNMDKDEAASLFLFSMLTFYVALATPRRSQPDGSFFIGEAGFPDWTFLLDGPKFLSNVLGERGQETLLAPFLSYGSQRWYKYRGQPTDAQPSGSQPVSSGDGSLLADLRRRIAASVTDPELLKTYAHAIDELELSLVSLQDPDAPRDVLDAMFWLWAVTESFVPLLKALNQEAVAVFAHFCILLKHHESHWWLQGWGDHLLSRAHEILDEEHRMWIEWPMRELGVGSQAVPAS